MKINNEVYLFGYRKVFCCNKNKIFFNFRNFLVRSAKKTFLFYSQYVFAFISLIFLGKLLIIVNDSRFNNKLGIASASAPSFICGVVIWRYQLMISTE